MLPGSRPESFGSEAEFENKNRAGLLTLVFTDIVGSTQLKQEFGDAEAVRLIQSHHELVRRILAEFREAREIETAGDSFLLVFSRPSDAVRFSVRLQQEMGRLVSRKGTPISDRIGIHLGEVLVEETTSKLFGMQVDTAARIMSLAAGGQILLSRLAFDTARQILRATDGAGPLRWLNHGPYSFKGIDEPIEVCEVRLGKEGDLAPRPPNSDKATRMNVEGELVLGWRPAVEETVPNTKWVLQEKLGEGAFGEVWLGRHSVFKQNHVFKFCFRLDRARSLKREVAFFRLLKERVGDHPNIVAIHEMFLDAPPFYVEMDYVPGKDLRSWCAAQGGAGKLPLDEKLEIIEQAADALQAAHECGIVHRDVKPGNLLIAAQEPGGRDNPADGITPNQRKVVCKLSDFGIGQILSDDCLGDMTRIGFTQTLVSDSSHSGTQMYMAPELLTGQPASIRTDIYALGIVLYQLLVGNLDQPLTTDWAADIEDPLLREDLQHCFAGHPEDRFSSAAQLAKNLRSLKPRHEARERARAEQQARELQAYRRGIARTAAVFSIIVLAMAGLALLAFYKSGVAKRAARLAEVKTGEAQRSADESRERLERLNIAKGTQRMEEGDLIRAIPWFVEGLRLVKNDPQRERIARIRIGTLFDHAPRLLQLWSHPDGVDSGVISADDKLLLTVTSGHTAHLWNLQTGAEVCPPLQHEGTIASGEFSPDGSLVLTIPGGFWQAPESLPREETNAFVWSAATGKLAFRLGHRSRVLCGAFSPDGQRIITGCADGDLVAWDSSRGKILFSAAPRQNRAIQQIALNRKRPQFFAVTTEGRLWVRSTEDGTPLFGPIEHGSGLQDAAFSPDGTLIATAGSNGAAQVWSAETGRRIGAPMQNSYSELMGIAFSPDSQRVATCGYDRTARVWDARTGAPVTPPLQHEHTVNKVGFSPDGGMLLTASFDGQARVWDSYSGQLLIPALPHSGTVMDADFLRNGHQIVTVSKDTLAKLWDIAVAVPSVPSLAHGGNGLLNISRFSPDGKTILTASSDGSAAVWDAGTGKRLHEWQLPAEISDAEYSRDGKLILSACRDGKVRIWSAGSFQPEGPELTHDKPVRLATFSADASIVLSASEDGTAVIWDRLSGKPKTTCRASAAVTWAQFSPDEKRVATACADGAARVWNSVNGEPLTPILTHPKSLVRVEFSPDGRQIVTAASDGTYAPCVAQVWDIQTASRVGRPLPHADGVLSAVFSFNGKYLATASEDATAQLWDAQTHEPASSILKHRHQVHFVEFDPSDELVLTGSSDYTARVWDLAGEPITPPLRHYSRVYCGGWDPSGLRIVSGVRINRAQVWDLTYDRRTVESLTLHAQALSGSRIDPLTGPIPLVGAALAQVWKSESGEIPHEIAPAQLASWHWLQAVNHWWARHWFTARDHLDRFMALDPNEPVALWERSICDHEQGLWDRALEDLNQAIELAPEKAFLFEERAHLYDFHLRDSTRAEKDYRRAFAQSLTRLSANIEKDGRSRNLWLQRGNLYLKMHAWLAAASDYSQALALSAAGFEKAEILHQRAEAHLENGSPAEALEDLRQAWKEDPTGQNAQQLAWVLLMGSPSNRDADLGFQLAGQAMAVEKPGDAAILTYGIAQFRRGDFELARQSLEKIGSNSPKLGLREFFLAMCEAKLGHDDAAREHFTQARDWRSAQSHISNLELQDLTTAQSEAESLMTVRPSPPDHGS